MASDGGGASIPAKRCAHPLKRLASLFRESYGDRAAERAAQYRSFLDRAVIELRHFQELSYDEIARALKRPLSDVKSDLFRARKMLGEALKDLR